MVSQRLGLEVREPKEKYIVHEYLEHVPQLRLYIKIIYKYPV